MTIYGIHKEFLEHMSLMSLENIKLIYKHQIVLLYTINKKIEILFLPMYHFNRIKKDEICLDKCDRRGKPVEWKLQNPGFGDDICGTLYFFFILLKTHCVHVSSPQTSY